MVDRSLDSGFGFARNIEDFMGDAACAILLDDYPKFTPLHSYIEFVVSSVICDESEADITELMSEVSAHWGKRLWVDHLLAAHGFNQSFIKWANQVCDDISVENYLQYLRDEDILPELLDKVAKEAFHILFTNRKVLHNFASKAAYQILENAADMYPEKFTQKGYLKRSHIPQWAKNAVFHRDKGICVICKTDITRLVNLQNGIHYDHIMPLAKGGMNDVTNLQILCEKCNGTKSAKMAATSYEYHSWYKY